MSFVRFFESVTGMRLTPAQRVADLVAFDGVDPIDLPAEDQAFARRIFGAVERVPTGMRRVVVARKGARVGGSLRSAIRLLHLGLTVDLKRLAPGEAAFGVIVGPDMRLAKQAFRFIEGAIDATPYLAKMVLERTATSVTLRRQDGRVVLIECLPASAGGSAIRGRSMFALQMTEGAFLRDESFAVNDVEIFRGALPRILPGGQLLIESTPWAKAGLLYELFSENWGAPVTALALDCPTLLMRAGDAVIAGDIERERLRDPMNARREFDAQFLDAGAVEMLSEMEIADAFRPLPDDISHFARREGSTDLSSMAHDWMAYGSFGWAMRRPQNPHKTKSIFNDAGVCVARDILDYDADGQLMPNDEEERKPLLFVADIGALKPSETPNLTFDQAIVIISGILRSGRNATATYDAEPLRRVHGDQHLAYAALPEFRRNGLRFVEHRTTQELKQQAFDRLKILFHSRQILLEDSADLRAQLATFKLKAKSGGQLEYGGRNRQHHYDLVSMLAMCVIAEIEPEGYSVEDSPIGKNRTRYEVEDYRLER